MFEVYATRWDSPAIVEELIPARDLEFSAPLSAHGECSFTATVEPGRSFWRSSISPVVSGVLVARDGVPVWQGWVMSERQTGPRSFSFSAVEWGAFFERTPAVVKRWTGWTDVAIFRDLVQQAQAVSGQDVKVSLGTSTGTSISDYEVKAWDHKSTAAVFGEIAAQADGPEWYFGTAGTLDNPVRSLVLGDRLGLTSSETVLEFVEDTEVYERPEDPPAVFLLGDLFQATAPVAVPGRRGGNVLAVSRTRDASQSATVATAVGSGEEAAQLVRTSTATNLLGAGWPRLTKITNYSDVTVADTLSRHARADLAATAGLTTGYSLATFADDPDWLTVPRGSTVTVALDTDVYAGERPYVFDARVLNMTVRVPDAGAAQVQWDIGEVLET